jgi:hypothetical protein
LRLPKPLFAIGITLGLGAFGAQLTACSSASPAPASNVPDASLPKSSCTSNTLTIAFSPMYSAFDGKHTFQVPALVVGSSGAVTWSADATMVGMQTDNERPNEILITMLKPGNVIINVSSADGKCGSSLLSISAAQESDWEIGNARYNNGQSLHIANVAPGGGSPLEQSGTGGPACTSCHGETATNGPFTNVSHTPEQTGGFSDDDLLGIILHGEFPDGGYFDWSIVPYPAWMNFHRWVDITPDQQRGIIVYLRSLTPQAQKGQVNFGAFDDTDAGDDAGDDAAVSTDASALDATGTGATSGDAGTSD